MKKNFFLLHLFLLLSTACSTYKVEGVSSVPSLDGQRLYLKVVDDDTVIDLDSCEIVHGSFCMKGEIDSVMLASLYLGGEMLMPFVLEKGKIKITIENKGLEAGGTYLNNQLYDFIRQKNELEQRFADISHKQMQLIINGVSADDAERHITQDTDTLVAEMNRLVADFVIVNSDNVLGLQIFTMYCQSFPRPVMTPTIREIIEKSSVSFIETPFVKDYLQKAEK